MDSFPEFMTQRRKAMGLTVRELASKAKIDASSVFKYLSGERPVKTIARARQLRTVLCPTPELKERFDRLYEEAQIGSSDSPLDLPMDSPDAKLRVESLNFLPFSGNPSAFMEKFVEKCLNLAVIRLEIVENPRKLPGGQDRFDLIERIESVQRRETDMVFNLISLQRLKKLIFIPTPLRIAINGVIFQSEAARSVTPPTESRDRSEDNTHTDGIRRTRASRLHEARRLLVYGEQPQNDPFCVVTVRHEVGHVFLEMTHHLKEALQPLDRDLLCDRCLVPQDTLNAKYLAAQMKKLGQDMPVMLVADEHTCLDVLRELVDNSVLGVLVMAPNSDQAIIHSVERRIPPAFFYGMGMSRSSNNQALVRYVQETFSTFLSVEGESIAGWLHELYDQLVRFVRDCLDKTGIYVGGIRRTNRRVDDPVPVGADPAAWSSALQTLVEQNARAVARKCLSLSRRSLESIPPEMVVWKPILTRARERIQVSDGGDRGRLRDIIIYCCKMTLGRDPFDYVVDPIALLRELVPVYESIPGGVPMPTAAQRRDLCPPVDRWNDFLYLMELELDMDLSKLQNCSERWFYESSDLGRLISKIQASMEISRDSQLILTIRDYQTDLDKNNFEQMQREYAETNKGLTVLKELPSDIPAGDKQHKKLVVYSLGAAVGFLEARLVDDWKPTPADLEAKVELHKTIRVTRLHVAQHMHHAGVTRRLIRSIVEEGNNTLRRGVWIESWLWENDDLEKFRKAGFLVFPGNRLFYELKLASGTKKPFSWELRPDTPEKFGEENSSGHVPQSLETPHSEAQAKN